MSDIKKVASSNKCVVLYGDKILLLRRSDTHPTRPGEWDLPGGLLDDGETPKEAVIREIKEETGLDVQNPKVFDVTFRNSGSIGDLILLLFWVEANDNEVTLSYEHSEHKWVSIDEAMELYPYEGRIESAKQYLEHYT